jgi:hypothetical protein
MLRLLAAGCLLVACATAGRDNPATNDGPASDGPTTDSTVEADANNCVSQPCDILTTCGCPADQACDVDGEDLNGTACRPVAANAANEDNGCSTASGCKAGLVCIGNPGHCRKYCDDNPDCGQPRGQCVVTITDGTNPIPGIPKTCTSNCDPTNSAANACPGGEKCSLFVLDVNGVDTNIVDCDTAGVRTNGQDCTTAGSADDALCAKDHLCVTTGGTTNTCRKSCIVGGAGICTGGACQAFTTPFIVGGTNYGFCPNG